MRYRKKLNDYINSSKTFYFSVDGLYATSYGWYYMLRMINGKLVLNDYKYSTTTARHVRQLKQLLLLHNITPDMIVEAPTGINGPADIIGYSE